MFSYPTFLQNRQYGIWPQMPWRDALYSTMYKSFGVLTCSETTPSNGQDWGAVFGFGFSPDGSLLAAACENNCMLLYDPHNARLITRKFKAHASCVNCVRFLDTRLFVTCSDDSTVRIWDMRHLKQELKVLEAHTNWVKNIEYCPSAGKLITSGFDGNIFSWDINNYSENDQGEQLLYINGIMRTKVCPDESRMIMSTIGGYFILIHDLDLDNLKEDLHGFLPQPTGSSHMFSLYSDMFDRKRNRVEFLSDFPEGDSAESISALEIHPQGWCIVSRNTTCDERAEWTCVHDIQADDPSMGKKSSRDTGQNAGEASHDLHNGHMRPMLAHHLKLVRRLLHHSLNSDEVTPYPSQDSDPAVSHNISTDNASVVDSSVNGSGGNNIDTARNLDTSDENGFVNGGNGGWVPWMRTAQSGTRSEPNEGDECKKARPRQARRLLFHSEEPNVGQGYIKEPSFSCDGRIIASPFGNCVRLLAFDSDCRELCDLAPRRPRPLRQVALTCGNRSPVLTSTFSPTHLSYVAGAKDGSISFCSPRL